MPIYTYTCTACGHVEDQLVKADESDREPCSRCGGEELERSKLNETHFALKGGGWSRDGYRSGKPLPGQPPVEGATKVGQQGGTTVYQAPPSYKTNQLEWDGNNPVGTSSRGREIADRNKEQQAKANEKREAKMAKEKA